LGASAVKKILDVREREREKGRKKGRRRAIRRNT
jgi:hypothetical protein